VTGLGEDLPRSAGAIWRRTLPVWAGLMALLAATVFSAYLPLGRLNLVLSLGIAVAKAALVLLFFMQLRKPNPLLRIAASAALVFMAFLFMLTFSDLLTRAAPTQPGTVMPRSIPGMPVTGQRAF
jgi:caa(3)-type oxidase subunit IV